MEGLLGKDGKGGDLKTQLDAITGALTGANGIKSIIDTASKAQAGQQTTLNVSAKFTELTNAVTAATGAIDEKLNSGDLTQLDTSNLKALKSSINDIQSQLENTFADFGADPKDAAAKIDPAKAKELLEAFKAVETSNTELGEKAAGVVTSSQNQAETVAEMKNDAESVF